MHQVHSPARADVPGAGDRRREHPSRPGRRHSGETVTCHPGADRQAAVQARRYR